ncbi:MAG: hypothetical protein I3273_01520 [Candidatus Moeniiplasma glomeromycotorum]|nr:hypothetical protein [Candidatus Moeniiplasma glomeromycotorum]MCE8167199.1 hypothetical protein [Candidatus Moeniiplasma glomeromycotorum]MCE8168789.1 hypothetical protein [Candidatus Moeniiplasma glomeromycotorum]
MNVNQRSKRQILGVSLSPQLYKRIKEEYKGKNISAFVEKAITKELAEKEKERQEFRKKLIKSYQLVAKSQKRKTEDEIWDETSKDGLK